MCDLSHPIKEPVVTSVSVAGDTALVLPGGALPSAIIPEAVKRPASWFTALDDGRKASVHWVRLSTLKLHRACKKLPWLERTYALIDASVGRDGFLTPLAVNKKGRVIDGRYRLKSAKKRGLEYVPVIVIDIDGDDVDRWVYQIKDAREHLNEEERAVLAFQYQGVLKGILIKGRAKKANAARNGAKITIDKRHTALPKKRDSRKESCDKFGVPTRIYRRVAALAKNRADLFEDVVAGKTSITEALKRKGKNIENERASNARKRNLAAAEAMAVAASAVIAATGGEAETTGVAVSIVNSIQCGDALEVLSRVPDGSASLILYSPDYPGVPIQYDPPLPAKTYSEWLDYQKQLLIECLRASRTGGRLAIVIDIVRNREGGRHAMWPVPADLTNIARSCGWDFFNEISWYKDEISGGKTAFGSFGLCSAPFVSRNHESILLFYNETVKLDGDKELCDFNSEDHLAWRTSEWHIKPEVDRDLRRDHPAPFPEEIPYRLIKMFTYGADLVIDPYNGSGTTTKVAKELGRKYLGIDQSPTYCDLARQRLATTSITEAA